MAKVKIISNPYEKKISFQCWNQNKGWTVVGTDNDKDSQLLNEKITGGFFPFKAEEIVKTQDPFLRTLNTGRQTLEIIQQGVDKGELSLEERELSWLDRFRDQLDEIPENEEEFIEEMKDELDDTKYNIHEYGL